MADAKRDGNYVTTLIAVSNADGVTPVVLWADPTTHRLLVSLSGSGSVVGPGSSTDNAIVRWDGTGGSTLQDSGILIDDTNNMVLVTSDGGALGSATKMWSDLFLASGAVLNFNNGNVAVTHSAGILTVGTGDLRVTTAGTNAASVVTVGGTQTLTAKTLTSPIIGTSPTAAGATWADLGTVTTIDINGGTIDGVTIGGASAGNITGLVITANTSFMPDANDGAVLGAAATAFSDLFLASGALIGFANGDAVITHSAGVIGVTTGDLRVTTAGTNAASVVTVGGTQTLTSKTLTSPVIAVIGSNTITLGTGTFTTLTFDAGATDPVITAASGILTVTTGELRITSANVGTNGDSVPTLSSTSTMTNKTLTSPTINTPTLGGAVTLAENASIDLDPAGSADGKYTGICITGTAGATLAFGQLIYLAVADSRWELCDADALATAGNILIGMCVLAAGADGNATKILLMGQIRADAQFPALTVGAAVYVGETAGAIQVAIPTGADNVIRVVGFALTADEIYFNPSQDHQTTVA